MTRHPDQTTASTTGSEPLHESPTTDVATDGGTAPDGGTVSRRGRWSIRGVERRARGLEIDLLEVPVVNRLVRMRGLQPTLQLLTLAGFVLVIMTGLFGSPVGNHNFSIVFVWIAWWAALMLLLVPVFGRAWCSICPIPAPAEWLSRRSVVQMTRQRFSFGIPWPARLNNIWVQNFAFLGVALFSPIILTRPVVTGSLLLGFIAVAAVVDLTFTSRDSTGNERAGRIFCRYLCPVSGFIGLYSMIAPFGMRVRSEELCEKHKRTDPACKECVAGAGPATDNSARASRNEGYGCPWFNYPGEVARNAYCGLCTECLKTCPLDNTTLMVKWFGDLYRVPKHKLDEAYKAFIMLGAAGIYSAVMLGWWPGLKHVGNFIDGASLNVFHLGEFVAYASILLGGTLLLIPAAHLVFTALSRLAAGNDTDMSLKELFVHHAYALVPLGLFSWMAFSVAFLLVNGSYIFIALNDPFGWGWNLLGLHGLRWTPVLTHWVPVIQAVILLGGVAISTYVLHRTNSQVYRSERAAFRATSTYAVFLVGITWVFLYLYMG